MLFPVQEAELRLVRFLPELLALQRSLVTRFQNVSEAEFQSIRGFISSHTSGKTVLQQEVSLCLGAERSLKLRGGGRSG